ncbi:kinase-like domain, phloem protein 2-like protein [Tanacetum coccineum]
MSLEDVKLATQDFSQVNIIGRGNFGNIYRGEVTHAHVLQIIAAKRLDKKIAEREAQFATELEILMEYNHENVIGLVGYCDEEEEKIIVYQYASRGSLDKYLSDDSLTWVMRLKICIDIAIGLEFLHGTVSSREMVIHRDINSSNILLFDDWKAKISNFGLSLVVETALEFTPDAVRIEERQRHHEGMWDRKENVIISLVVKWLGDIRPRVVKPKISNDVEFEINSNFMRELKRKLFKGTDYEDAHEHVRRVLEIVDLFHFHGVTHDAVMLRVFPITLKGPALRWINRLSAGLVTTWDLLEKAFIRQYCPPFKTAKKLEIIRNFKQEMDETLYHAWERYSDLLYRCPQHDMNSQQKVHIFYTGLDISTLRMLDSRGFIPLMTPTQALKSIQVMAEHSHDWYDETTTRGRINDSSNNVDAIQANFKRAHLTK